MDTTIIENIRHISIRNAFANIDPNNSSSTDYSKFYNLNFDFSLTNMNFIPDVMIVKSLITYNQNLNLNLATMFSIKCNLVNDIICSFVPGESYSLNSIFKLSGQQIGNLSFQIVEPTVNLNSYTSPAFNSTVPFYVLFSLDLEFVQFGRKARNHI